jgi:8-oxo-dGTP pyrophosphatase MutT (NUDIX family)
VYPISSYGLVCFRVDADAVPSYLLVQRKDSLQFVEFVRGKYDPRSYGAMLAMVSLMTRDEQELLASATFSDLWARVWGACAPRRCLAVEHATSLALHAVLQSRSLGYDLREVVGACRVHLLEREWGFPKGRRNIRELDSDCAVREFVEETGVERGAVRRLDTSFEEEFSGTNGVRYRHKYYLAHAVEEPGSGPVTGCDVPTVTDVQAREIACTRWMRAEEACQKLAGCPTRLAVMLNAHVEAVRLTSCA